VESKYKRYRRRKSEKVDELEQTNKELLRRIFELEREKTDLLSVIHSLEGRRYPNTVKNLQKETQAPPSKKSTLQTLRANMNSPRKD